MCGRVMCGLDGVRDMRHEGNSSLLAPRILIARPVCKFRPEHLGVDLGAATFALLLFLNCLAKIGSKAPPHAHMCGWDAGIPSTDPNPQR